LRYEVGSSGNARCLTHKDLVSDWCGVLRLSGCGRVLESVNLATLAHNLDERVWKSIGSSKYKLLRQGRFTKNIGCSIAREIRYKTRISNDRLTGRNSNLNRTPSSKRCATGKCDAKLSRR
jgi:hypothetical protein